MNGQTVTKLIKKDYIMQTDTQKQANAHPDNKYVPYCTVIAGTLRYHPCINNTKCLNLSFSNYDLAVSAARTHDEKQTVGKENYPQLRERLDYYKTVMEINGQLDSYQQKVCLAMVDHLLNQTANPLK